MFYRLFSLFFILSSFYLNGYEQTRTTYFDEKEEDRTVLIRTLLTEQEVDAMIKFLTEHQIKATKKKSSSSQLKILGEGIWSLYVPLVNAVETTHLLDEGGFLKKKKISLCEEYIVRQKKLYENYDKKSSKEIEQTLKTIPGILGVDVLIKDESAGSGKEEKIAAIVYILHDGVLDDPHGEKGEEIKKSIFDSISGLKEGNLTFITEKVSSNSCQFSQ